MDDASSVSYVDEELAGALGLSATYEQVVVNVVNDSVSGGTFGSLVFSTRCFLYVLYVVMTERFDRGSVLPKE